MPNNKIRGAKAFIEVLLDRTGLKRGFAWMKRAAAKAGQGLKSVGKGLVAFGASGAAGLGFAIKKFAEFDDQMRSVRGVTGATESQFRSLTEKARELGRTTSFTAAEVAGLMTELGRAGFDPKEIEAASESMLNLARASGTELPRAAEIGAAAIRGFGLSADDSGMVSDVLAATVNSSAQSLEDLFEAMKPVAPLAAEAGASIQDTAAAIGILANNGIKGSLAGNSLGRAYKNLSSSKTAGTLKALGVAVKDTSGNLLPLSDILKDVGEKTKDMGSADKLAAFESIFGRASAAALKLAAPGAAFENLRDKIVNSTGVAAATAKEMDSGVGGAFRRLSSAVEGILLSVGDKFAGTLSTVADKLSGVSARVTEWIDKNPGLITAIGALVFGSLTLGAALTALGFILPALVAGIGALFSPIGIAVALVAGLGGGLLYLSKTGTNAGGVITWLKEKFGPLVETAKAAFQGIKDALNAGDYKLAAKLLWLGIKTAWLEGTQGLRASLRDWKKFFLDTWHNMLTGARKMLLAFQTGTASLFVEIIARVQGLDVEEVQANLQQDARNRLGQINRTSEQGQQQRDRDYEQQIQDAAAELASTRAEMNAALAEAKSKVAKPNVAGETLDKKQEQIAAELAKVSTALQDGQVAKRIKRSTSAGSENLKSVSGFQTLIGLANKEKTADEIRELRREQTRRHREIKKVQSKKAKV